MPSRFRTIPARQLASQLNRRRSGAPGAKRSGRAFVVRERKHPASAAIIVAHDSSVARSMRRGDKMASTLSGRSGRSEPSTAGDDRRQRSASNRPWRPQRRDVIRLAGCINGRKLDGRLPRARPRLPPAHSIRRSQQTAAGSVLEHRPAGDAGARRESRPPSSGESCSTSTSRGSTAGSPRPSKRLRWRRWRLATGISSPFKPSRSTPWQRLSIG